MPSIYQLKPAFQKLLRPLCRRLATAGVTANQVTLAAVLLSLLTGLLIAYQAPAVWPLLLLPPVLLIRMALNAIDGMLAREHGMASALGAILNELGDVIADSALWLPLAFLPGVSGSLIVGVTVLAILTEMTGVIGLQIGASRRYDGPLGKSDRALLLGSLGLLLGLGLSAGLWLDGLLGLTLLFLGHTIYNRAHQALLEIGQIPAEK
ncbi:MAG: CDP-alcohol phosphatidyltransferase family protein [Candidatus Competibacteraceae bacterium]|nr:CDP-alcohol phosphatidyltransferase family protein [Candidatus Competibacteraceae bacterium]